MVILPPVAALQRPRIFWMATPNTPSNLPLPWRYSSLPVGNFTAARMEIAGIQKVSCRILIHSLDRDVAYTEV